MKVFLTNLGKYNEGELVGMWLELPSTEEELNAALRDIGVGEKYEEYFLTDYENDMGLEIGEYESLNTLNEVANLISSLNGHGLKTLKAVIQLESPAVSDIPDIIDRLDEYTLHTDIHDDEDLGRYYIHELGCYDLESMGRLAKYLDYEAYGRDIRLESDGGFTSFGWLER